MNDGRIRTLGSYAEITPAHVYEAVDYLIARGGIGVGRYPMNLHHRKVGNLKEE